MAKATFTMETMFCHYCGSSIEGKHKRDKQFGPVHQTCAAMLAKARVQNDCAHAATKALPGGTFVRCLDCELLMTLTVASCQHDDRLDEGSKTLAHCQICNRPRLILPTP